MNDLPPMERTITPVTGNPVPQVQTNNSEGFSYFSIIHDDLTLYVPGVTSIPGTDYIGFLPTVTLSHHENCPTFVSFMYSNDGGRIIHLQLHLLYVYLLYVFFYPLTTLPLSYSV